MQTFMPLQAVLHVDVRIQTLEMPVGWCLPLLQHLHAPEKKLRRYGSKMNKQRPTSTEIHGVELVRETLRGVHSVSGQYQYLQVPSVKAWVLSMVCT